MKGSLSLPGWESTAGENSKQAKLNERKVREIRQLRNKQSIGEVAALYSVTRTCIRDIWNRRRWASVKDDDQ